MNVESEAASCLTFCLVRLRQVLLGLFTGIQYACLRSWTRLLRAEGLHSGSLSVVNAAAVRYNTWCFGSLIARFAQRAIYQIPLRSRRTVARSTQFLLTAKRAATFLAELSPCSICKPLYVDQNSPERLTVVGCLHRFLVLL